MVSRRNLSGDKMKPTILIEGEYSKKGVEDLKKQAVKTKDIYLAQVAELFEIDNPKIAFTSEFGSKQKEHISSLGETELLGDWIFYPWSKILVHAVNREQYFRLRTDRNKDIINSEEQEKLENFTIGLLGLSVGSGIAVNAAYTGISNSMKIADFDTLDTTNLNRVRARLDQIGERKIDIMAQQVYEINPYADLHLYDKGLNEENIEDFVGGDPKPRVIFEIIDDFKMKIRVRMVAKKHGVPVVMLTNLGDSILIDVERYDTEPDTEIFNGKIGHLAEEILAGKIGKEEEKKYAIGIVGPENIPERVLETVKNIGIEHVGRPQLMSTVSVSGGIGSVIIRRLVLGSYKSGRYKLSLEDLSKSS